jgi:RNA polymerase sigma-70 factor (ECF subfamily)
LDDLALIREIRKGSHDAFRVLVERYSERVLNVVYQLVGDRNESEDVVQDIFVKVYRKLDSFELRSSFYTWLYRIAVNTASDHLKRRRRRDEAVSLEALPPIFEDGSRLARSPHRAVLDDELRARIDRAVESLPEPYKTVLILREFEDCSYEQMAEILGCSIGTVESRLFRARQRLREKLMSYLRG